MLVRAGCYPGHQTNFQATELLVFGVAPMTTTTTTTIPTTTVPTTTTAPPLVVWRAGGVGQSCDAVCNSECRECNSSAMSAIRSASAVEQAAEEAGLDCKSVADDYVSWAPFIRESGTCEYFRGNSGACTPGECTPTCVAACTSRCDTSPSPGYLRVCACSARDKAWDGDDELPFELKERQGQQPIYTAECDGKHATALTNDELKAQIPNIRSFTVAAWVKLYDVTYPHTTFAVQHGKGICGRIYGKDATPGWDFGHGYRGGRGIAFCMFDGNHTVETRIKFDEDYQPHAWVGGWMHQMFVVDRDAGTLASVVNGIRMKHVVDLSVITGDAFDPDYGVKLITKAAGNNLYGWNMNGIVHDFRFYDYALPLPPDQDGVHLTTTTVTTMTTTTTIPTRIITMPLSSFSNDEQTATQSLDDGSGTFTTATLHGGVKLGGGWMPGSSAFEFDNAGNQGSASQYLSIDSDFTIGGRALAICASIRFTSIAKNTRIFDFGNGPGGESLQLYTSGSTDPNIPKDLVWEIFRSGQSKYVYISKIMTLHTWFHVCASVSSDGAMAIFVNGEKKDCHIGSDERNACKDSNGWTPGRVDRLSAYLARPLVSNYPYFHGLISDLLIMDGKAITTNAEAADTMPPTPAISTTSTAIITTTHEVHCGAGEAYDAGTFDRTGNITVACAQCQPGTTQEVADVCNPCPRDAVEGYTIVKHVGTCLELATKERLAKLAAQAEADASGGEEEQPSGLPTEGKIAIPLGILGFLGGLLVAWYCLKSDKKAKEKQAQPEQEMRTPIIMQEQQGSKEKEKKRKKTKKKKEAVKDENFKSATVTKTNPVYVPEEDAGEGGGAGGHLEISIEDAPANTEQIGANADFQNDDAGKNDNAGINEESEEEEPHGFEEIEGDDPHGVDGGYMTVGELDPSKLKIGEEYDDFGNIRGVRDKLDNDTINQGHTFELAKPLRNAHDEALDRECN